MNFIIEIQRKDVKGKGRKNCYFFGLTVREIHFCCVKLALVWAKKNF